MNENILTYIYNVVLELFTNKQALAEFIKNVNFVFILETYIT